MKPTIQRALRITLFTVLWLACYVVLSPTRVPNAADAPETIEVFDQVCLANLSRQCVATFPAVGQYGDRFPNLKPGEFPCPHFGYITKKDPKSGERCLRNDPEIYNYCEVKTRVDDAPTCKRTIRFAELLNEMKYLNNTLRTDIRTLLTQFCKTYAPDQAKCNELLVPPAEKSK
jgi:hypothetical protein